MPPPQAGSNRVFASTGIHELNNLLTRDGGHHSGIGLPTEGGVASSITVIKGEMGVGKSALSTILAHNIPGREIPFGDHILMPFVLYLSFSQPASGLYHYIDEILPREQPEKRLCPLIISPHVSEQQDIGLENLAEFLNPFDPAGQGPVWNEVLKWDTASDLMKRYVDERITMGHSSTEVGRRVIPELSEEQRQKRVKLIPLVCVDAINFFFNASDARSVVAKLVNRFRTNRWPLLATIEDAGSAAAEKHRQLMSWVEFESDTVIELAVQPAQYIRHTIKVKKNRNSQPRFGTHLYRIEPQGHSLWNIPPKHGEPKHTGFMVFPSIHWFLSQSRDRHDSTEGYHSGMDQFDRILWEGLPTAKPDDAKTQQLLPRDAFILVRGGKGGHKLPIAFNLLAAGLWDHRREERQVEKDASGNIVRDDKGKPKDHLICEPTDRVMLISLGEEINLTIPKIALGHSLGGATANDNSGLIEFGGAIEPPIEPIYPESHRKPDPSYKLVIREWKAHSPSDPETEQGTLVEARFKPGHLSPDEFLWVVQRLVEEHKPSRVLVENTAHLQMSFPELYQERMLFPALASWAQSKQIMLIVTDVMGEGSDQQLSYGLSAGADFVVDLAPLDVKQFEGIEIYHQCHAFLNGKVQKSLPDRAPAPAWSRMVISNVRGKNYRRAQYAVAVFTQGPKNCLFLSDITEFFAAGSCDPDRFLSKATGATRSRKAK
jgi:hypothetical protein